MKLYDVAVVLKDTYTRRLLEIKGYGKTMAEAKEIAVETAADITCKEVEAVAVTLHEAEDIANDAITAELISALTGDKEVENKIIEGDSMVLDASEVMSLMNIAYKMGYTKATEPDEAVADPEEDAPNQEQTEEEE